MTSSISPRLHSEDSLVRENVDESTDSAWLQSLTFRKSASAELVAAAQGGNVEAVAHALQQGRPDGKKTGKRQRRELRQQLADIWQAHPGELSFVEREQDSAGLASCLFSTDLEPDELTGRIETIMAATSTTGPEPQSLVAALWILRLCPHLLEPGTLVSLWRWTLDGARQLRTSPAAVSADQGCAAFDQLEVHCLAGWTFVDLQGEGKFGTESVKALHQALDAATDGDGSPHARWLPEILPRLTQLARLQLFADSLEKTLWDGKSEKRIRRLLGRLVGLTSAAGLTLGALPAAEVAMQVNCLAKIFGVTLEPAARRLLKSWEKGSQKSFSHSEVREIRKQFQKESHQSDWGEWGILRSGWASPTDLCVIRHDGTMPELTLLVKDVPLFSGVWGHQLSVNGKPISFSEGWNCCCWYLDQQAVFLELQTKEEGPVQVIRQALLLRKESVLVIGDSVRFTEPGDFHYQRQLPFSAGWDLLEDGATRELALTNGEHRVRVFPWSSPQNRIDRGAETTRQVDGSLQLDVTGSASGLYSATLFDWSDSRRDEPADWQRLTVSEDGRYIPPEIASAYRLRLGKKQWVVYHSLTKPQIPRTALGIHTGNETVIAEFAADGEIKTLVEVEL